MNIKDQLEAAKSRLAVAQGAISKEDLQEQADRAELARLTAEAEATELSRRKLDLDRRLDAAREKLPAETAVVGVMVQGYPDSFVVRRNGEAHASWLKAVTKGGEKADTLKLGRDYALRAIYDWNGVVEPAGEDLMNLNRFLEVNPGVVIPVTDAAAKLAGAFAEDFKS
jgi:hypothetical protein